MAFRCAAFFGILASAATAQAGTYFIEAESFQSTGGWRVIGERSARECSGLAALDGATGKADGTASTTVAVKDAGKYRIWVRYSSPPSRRGPFRVTASAGARQLGGETFDLEAEGRSARDTFVWGHFAAELPEGDVTLTLSKHENKNAGALARHVDCLLLTQDEGLVPNHLHFGAQTFLRITLGEGLDRPAYIHVFADHFHAPWYQHYSLGRSGAVAATTVKKPDQLKAGEQTAWCNITPMIYQDSGAMLHVTARHSYVEYAERLHARFEFATAPDEKSIVRTIEIDNRPAGFAVFLPPNLLTPENLALLKTDREIAEATGKRADDHPWPTHGKVPERFPFLVSAMIEPEAPSRDARVIERERKTLEYFGFNEHLHRHVRGAWFMLDGSFCKPDIAKMQTRIAAAAAEYKKSGESVDKIVFAELMDEPTGQPLEFIARDPAYLEKFRAWLKGLGKTPADLLVADWEAVRPVTEADRDQFPALYLYSQRFRTRALGDFMAVQRGILEKEYGRTLPTLVNFSDGAVYGGNFCLQGVDYFELLDADDQNAIWGEDWSALASTYQCASYNVDLMRAAARDRGQVIGHHLIAYANRTPWDVKLKATSEAARGVKIFNNFCYGPSWATHEGGPYWRSSVWYAKPATWTANASITREIGAVEDLLLEAMPARAETAMLYSSSSDAWTVKGNLSYGFDRMHTWLALAHAQVPVDVVGERQAERGGLDGYKVCYLSGPNLSRAAAEKLAAWVRAGGTLWLTAGAAARDEFNRPLSTIEELLPMKRGECRDLQSHVAAGSFIKLLAAKDHAVAEGVSAEVLSVKQTLEAPDGTEVLARFDDRSPALVRAAVGQGTVYSVGFLPGLAYVKPALVARQALSEKFLAARDKVSPDDAAMLERSANPWEFPDSIRRLILTPVEASKVKRPIRCDTPLVDAVYMPHPKGVLVPLANYTNRPLGPCKLTIEVPRPIRSVVSAVRGTVPFRLLSDGRVEISLPLDNNDFLKLLLE
jgi:hypothetical protein